MNPHPYDPALQPTPPSDPSVRPGGDPPRPQPHGPGYGGSSHPGSADPPYGPPPRSYGPGMPAPYAYPYQPGYAPQPAYPAAQPAPAKRKRNVPLLVGGGVAAAILLCCVGLCAFSALAGRLTMPLTTRGTPTPSETVLAQDALTTNANGWADDADCAFRGDGYHITSASICYYPRRDFGDANVSVTVRRASGDASSSYGIAMRRPSEGNYYAFEITGDGRWHFVKGATALVADTASAAIKAGVGQANTLTVHMKGGHFDLYANGAKVGQADDTNYASGKVGLTGDTGADVVYTDFRVTQPA